MKKAPEGNCSTCGGLCRVIKHTTFSYWYCDSCKDEPRQVWLKSVTRPKEAKGAYILQDPSDILIDKPGVYHITYTNGESEYYEHTSNSGVVRLYRDRVRDSERLTDRDVPSRVRVQCLATTSTGEGREPSLRAVSDTKDSVPGCDAELRVYDWMDAWPFGKEEFIARYPLGYKRVTVSGYEYDLTEEEVRKLAPSHFGVQHGSMPPDDQV